MIRVLMFFAAFVALLMASVLCADEVPIVVQHDAKAYEHAKKEAALMASLGIEAYKAKPHPMGVAPGCTHTGTGISKSITCPAHCFLGTYPYHIDSSKLVARAVARGSDGQWYWSAHYRVEKDESK